MHEQLYDITIAESRSAHLQGHLLLEVGQTLFAYTVLDAEKKLLQLRVYRIAIPGNGDLALEVGQIIRGEPALQGSYESTTIVYNFPENVIVPETGFSAGNGGALVELMHGDLNKGITLSERIQGRSFYNVYRVPLDVHRLLQRQYNHGKSWHYYSLWRLLEDRRETPDSTSFCVTFYPNRLMVMVTRDNVLQVVQAFEYEVAGDVAYYLLNICRQLLLSPESVVMHLSGMIDESSSLYLEIIKYFGKAAMDHFAYAASVPALREYPEHFFSPLLNMALCVS
jgi:hypothetical protein